MNENREHVRDILTAQEVADYLKVSKPTVYKLARAGEIPAVRLGGTWRFSRSLLDEWLDGQMRGNVEGDSPSSEGTGADR